jgi:hypothetical protein
MHSALTLPKPDPNLLSVSATGFTRKNSRLAQMANLPVRSAGGRLNLVNGGCHSRRGGKSSLCSSSLQDDTGARLTNRFMGRSLGA